MDSLPVINRVYEVYKPIVEINSSLGKRFRYSIGSSTETTVLDLMEFLIMAKNAPKTIKLTYLIRASSLLEILRFKLRVLLEMRLANETVIFQLQAKLEEVGRMLGGWMKAIQSM